MREANHWGLRVSAPLPEDGDVGSTTSFNLAFLNSFDLQAGGTSRAPCLTHPSWRRRHGDVNIQINPRQAAGVEHDTN